MGKPLQAADNSHFVAFPDLGLSPVLLHIGSFDLRWYSIAYLAGIFIGFWYLLKLLKQPGAPMARRHADDVLLGDAFHEPALGHFALHIGEQAGAQVRADEHYAIVALGERVYLLEAGRAHG